MSASQIQLRRGTEAANDAFTGAEGEVVYDTELKELRTHDGTTEGGKKVASQEWVTDQLGVTVSGNSANIFAAQSCI